MLSALILPTGLVGFPGGSDGEESAYIVGDPDLIPGLEKSPEEGYGYPLLYFCLENSMDRRAWWATVWGVAELDMTKRLTFSHFQPWVL